MNNMSQHQPEAPFKNPFRPGAGHMPPYLAGREEETKEFKRLLGQTIILENLVLTGLRGVGKTVLLDTFKPLAIAEGWLWVGTDLSESTSISEVNLSTRLLTDLAVVTSSIVTETKSSVGFGGMTQTFKLDYSGLKAIFENTPGLVADKLKRVLETVWHYLSQENSKGLIFAYDEAQNLTDYPARDQFPVSLLLDVFQSIQKKEIPFMLVLTGLPTLFPKLVEARTFAERMFRVVMLDKLDNEESRAAILTPIQKANCPVRFDDESVQIIIRNSGGYPYFIQFICREVYDAWIQQIKAGDTPGVPEEAIARKLDTDFFAGRWARATDRQRELLTVVAYINKHNGEFTVQEVVEKSGQWLIKSFGSSQVSQMLASLCEAGLVYKNRHGRYSLAVPLLDQFILRQLEGS